MEIFYPLCKIVPPTDLSLRSQSQNFFSTLFPEECTLSVSLSSSYYRLTFTRASYNVSIPENCVGKTYARPQERMGILTTPEVSVRYKIVSGDKDKHFKAEAKQVRVTSANLGQLCKKSR